MWELIFMILILKIPMAYVCWVVWWAVKAEPEIGQEEQFTRINWQPWRPQNGDRPRRGDPHEPPRRVPARPSDRRDRVGT